MVWPRWARALSGTLVVVSRAEHEVRTEVAVNDRAVELDEDDRVWLAKRLEEYEDLLAYLREH